MKNIIYKDIAEKIGKSEQTIRGYKVNNPNLLEVLKIGVFCIRNNLDIDRIKKLVEVQEAIKEKSKF